MLAIKNHVVTKLPILEIDNEMVIFEEGDRDCTMYFVLEGDVTLYVKKTSGDQEVAHIRKNQFFGENELYTQTARTIGAKTTSPTKLVAIKTAAEFENFVTENRFLSGKIMEEMSTKLAQTNAILATKKLANTQSSVVLEVATDDPHGKGSAATRRIIRH